MIRVGIVGYGMAAQVFHLPFLLEHKSFRVQAIVSSQREALQSALPTLNIYEDLNAMLERESLDLVVITTPNYLHYPQAKQCLEAGIAVVLEKPMTTNLDDAKRLKALCEQKNGFLRVFHNRRFDGDYLTVKALIQEGKLGKIKVFQSYWDRFRPVVRARWREGSGDGAGIWFDLAPHLLDQALDLFGLPQAVTARLSILREGGLSDDYAHVLLHYPEHEVVLNTSPFQAAPNPRFHIQGTEGTFVKYGLDPQENHLKEGLRAQDADYGIEDKALYGTLYRPNQAPEIIPTQRGQFSVFYHEIEKTLHQPHADSPLASLDEALNVMRVLEASIQSALQQRTLLLSSF